MNILAVIQGYYGERIVENIKSYAPDDWKVITWNAPSTLPPVIDQPEEFLPENLPSADLLLSLGESPAVAELIPDLARLSGARSVIAPCDNPDWLPPGLGNQIKNILHKMEIDYTSPRPFCSLNERSDQNKYIQLFARLFGKPEVNVHRNQGQVEKIEILREAPCGCTRFIARELAGVKLEKAEEKAALSHHYYPCLASGKMGGGFEDSLLHQSANMTKAIIRKALRVRK